MNKMRKGTLTIYTDGGARGNPGPAAIGVVIREEKGEILSKIAKRIGETTNNVAEYTGVIEALKEVLNKKYAAENIKFFLDSRLVVNQLNGFFKIKESKLRDLLMKIRELESEVGANISYNQIPREENQTADGLVNFALDN